MIDNDIFIGKEYEEFNEIYRVYKAGFVYSVNSGKVFRPADYETDNGFCPSFNYSRKGGLSTSSIRFDKLIAGFFCKKPLDKDGKEYPSYKIRHLDGEILNCAADNLEWVAPIYITKNKKGPVCRFPEDLSGTRKRVPPKYILIDTWRKTWYEDNKYSICNTLDISPITFSRKLKTNGELINNRYIITEDISLTLEYCD